MPDDIPFFHVALNLPHAGRIARRILNLVSGPTPGLGAEADALRATAAKLESLLVPHLESDENPPPFTAGRVRDEAATLARKLVDEIERSNAGHDRLGQCVRNLFECLELGREGAVISLRAGEDPKSFQRPS